MRARYVLERTGLVAGTVDRDVLALKCLDHKVRDDSAVAHVHARAERVEDPCDPNLDIALLLVGEAQRLGNALSLRTERDKKEEEEEAGEEEKKRRKNTVRLG